MRARGWLASVALLAAGTCIFDCGGGGDNSHPPAGDDTGSLDATTHDAHGESAPPNDAPRADGGDANDASEASDDASDASDSPSFQCTATYDAGSAACASCVHSSCCGSLANCYADTTCATALQCFDQCFAADGGYGACSASCQPVGSEQVVFSAFIGCAQIVCGGPCGFPSDGGIVVNEAGAEGGGGNP